jgi:N-acetylglutamate synthase-like GNAT family acetyltransferase
MKQLIACCGLDCEMCDARIATLTNDDALREATARKWAVMNNSPEISAETINCLGCRTEGTKFAWCSMCEIRSCAVDKGFETCGECAELGTCHKVEPVLEHAPDARNNLAG